MRLVIGICIGLLFGLAIGIAAVVFLQQLDATKIRKSDRHTAATQTTASYVCQWNGGTRESALIIKGDSSGAKEMIFPYRTDADRFHIDQTNDLHYIATSLEEKESKIFTSTLDLNRVTGDLYIVNRYTPEAMQIMTAFCGKRIQGADCRAEMAKLGGGDLSCLVISEDYCKSLLEGNNFQMRSGYSCRAAERRF